MHNFFRLNTVRIVIVLFALNLFSSCQKEVHIKLNSAPSQLVVEGTIQTGQPPVVLLTSSLSFFSSIDLSTLQNIFVHGATVKVSDGTKTALLKEYSIDTGGNNLFYFYTLDTTNPSNLILGQVNKFYTLTIDYAGTTYTSVTKIPNPKGIDTMYIDSPSFKGSKTPKNALSLYVNYTDPDTPGNYVRSFTKRNSEPYYPADIYSDEIINGNVVPKIEVPAGYAHVQDADGDSLRFFYPGDTVTIEWTTIDKGTFDFWNSLNYAQQSTGNPFSSPINVKSNISNGALGVWSGYGTTFKTLVIPR